MYTTKNKNLFTHRSLTHNPISQCCARNATTLGTRNMDMERKMLKTDGKLRTEEDQLREQRKLRLKLKKWRERKNTGLK